MLGFSRLAVHQAALVAFLAMPGVVHGQDVEIISGVSTSVEASGPDIRVMAFVQLDSSEAEHRVITPLLPSEVLSVQQRLSLAGYDSSPADGRWGPATELAISSFQSDRGLEPCACLDYDTAIGLGLNPRIVQTVIGTPEDEPQAEVLHGRGRAPIEPAVTPEVIEAPPETVVVVREVGGWWATSGYWPLFQPAAPVGQAPSAQARGIPIGPPIRLGPRRSPR